MPRIDPLQLLKCLSVLLTPEGGILSREEVTRLVSLMTKFSKKLVSKCVYVLILSHTETSLLESFMAEGGWTLVQTLLEDAMKTCNDDLVVEILRLLLITPVDIERLKSNTIPRLVKTLTKREGNGNVKELSSELVQRWLAIVKSTTQEIAAGKMEITEQKEQQQESVEVASEVTLGQQSAATVQDHSIGEDENKGAINTGTFYKLSFRGGKQVISRLPLSENEAEVDGGTPGEQPEKDAVSLDESTSQSERLSDDLDKKKPKSDKDKSKSRSSSSSSSKSSSSRSSSSHKDKDKDRHKSSSSKSSSYDKGKSSSSSGKEKDREKDKKDKDKDKHRSNGLLKHGSSSKDKKDSSKDKKDHHKESKDVKEKQAEKDKDTLAKIKPQTLDKLGRIPKKSSSSDKDKSKENDKPKENEKSKESDKSKECPKEIREQKKKGTMSIEVRKNAEERPKTVKVFNSKMRSTGLEEEVKPPPPRSAAKKPQSSTVLPSIPQKRPSPPREAPAVPEKKVKLDQLTDRPVPERPGAIKLIPPKPKRSAPGHEARWFG